MIWMYYHSHLPANSTSTNWFTINKMKLSSVIFLVVTFYGCAIGAPDKIVCYYGSWAVYRPGLGKFDVEQLAPLTSLCTHMIFGFAGLDANTNKIKALDAWNELEDNYGKGAYKRFNALRRMNPSLKTILAIGGWNEGSVSYSKMAANSASRRVFVNSVVDFLKLHDFNGLDMDWEYPGNRGGAPSDKENFVHLLRELRQEFDNNDLLLTSAVSAGKATIDTAYDVPLVAKYLHFINVMTYDFNGAWNSYVGHNSPIFASPQASDEQKMLNMNYSINYWIKNGAPREKIVLGMGLYGRSFRLANPTFNKPGDGAVGAGTEGPYTREPGTLGYNEICERQDRWTVVQEPYFRAPYAYNQNDWVGYDDMESIKIKIEYAKCMGLGGAMVWSVETDDFHGNCHGETFPLLKTIKRVLDGGYPNCPVLPEGHLPNTIIPTHWPHTSPDDEMISTSESLDSGETSETGSPVMPTSQPFYCVKEGLFRDPEDCSKFYSCERKSNGFKVTHHRCSEGTVFDQSLQICQWPDKVPECNYYYH